eukprot:403331802
MQEPIIEENKSQLASRKSPNLDFLILHIDLTKAMNSQNQEEVIGKVTRAQTIKPQKDRIHKQTNKFPNDNSREHGQLPAQVLQQANDLGQATQALLHGNLNQGSNQIQQQNQGNILAGSQGGFDEQEVNSVKTDPSLYADSQNLNANKPQNEKLQVSDINKQKSQSKTQERSSVQQPELMSQQEFQIRLLQKMDRISFGIDKLSSGIDLLTRSQLKITSRDQLLQEYKSNQSNFNMSEDGLQNLNRQQIDFLVDSDDVSQINANNQGQIPNSVKSSNNQSTQVVVQRNSNSSGNQDADDLENQRASQIENMMIPGLGVVSNSRLQVGDKPQDLVGDNDDLGEIDNVIPQNLIEVIDLQNPQPQVQPDPIQQSEASSENQVEVQDILQEYVQESQSVNVSMDAQNQQVPDQVQILVPIQQNEVDENKAAQILEGRIDILNIANIQLIKKDINKKLKLQQALMNKLIQESLKKQKKEQNRYFK